jgi:hypothetical protein
MPPSARFVTMRAQALLRLESGLAMAEIASPVPSLPES